MYFQCRYLARATIIPFKFKPPDVEIRILDDLLQIAPAAFPKLLKVGKCLDDISDDEVRSMREQVLDKVDGVIDARLATQYVLTIMCAQKVSRYVLYIVVFNLQLNLLSWQKDQNVPVLMLYGSILQK